MGADFGTRVPWLAFETSETLDLLMLMIEVARNIAHPDPVEGTTEGDGEHHPVQPAAVSEPIALSLLLAGAGYPAIPTPELQAIVAAGYAHPAEEDQGLEAGSDRLVLNLSPLLLIEDVIRGATQTATGPTIETVGDGVAAALARPGCRMVVEQLLRDGACAAGTFAEDDVRRLLATGLIEIAPESGRSMSAASAARVQVVPQQVEPLRRLLELVPASRWGTLDGFRGATLAIIDVLTAAPRYRIALREERLLRENVSVAEAQSLPIALAVEPVHPEDMGLPPEVVSASADTGLGTPTGGDQNPSILALALRLRALAQAPAAMSRVIGGEINQITRAARRLAESGLAESLDVSMGDRHSRTYYLTPFGAYVGAALQAVVGQAIEFLSRNARRRLVPCLGNPLRMRVLTGVATLGAKATLAELASLTSVDLELLPHMIQDLVDVGLLRLTNTHKGMVRADVSPTGTLVLRAWSAYNDLMSPEPRWQTAFRIVGSREETRADLKARLGTALKLIAPSAEQTEIEVYRLLAIPEILSGILALARWQVTATLDPDTTKLLRDLTRTWHKELRAAGVYTQNPAGQGTLNLPTIPPRGYLIGHLLGLVVPGTPGHGTTLEAAVPGFTPELIQIIRFLDNSDGTRAHASTIGLRGMDWPNPQYLPAIRALAERYIADPGGVDLDRPSQNVLPHGLRELAGARRYWTAPPRAKTAREIATATHLPLSVVTTQLERAEARGLGRYLESTDDAEPRFAFEPWVAFFRAAVEPIVSSALEVTRANIADRVIDHLADATDAALIAETIRGNLGGRPVTAAGLAGLHLRGVDGIVLTADAVEVRLRALSRDGLMKLTPSRSGSPEGWVTQAAYALLDLGREFQVQGPSSPSPGGPTGNHLT